MSAVHWGREQATAPFDPAAADDLAGHVLVLHDLSAADDGALGWVRRAPCVVVAVAPDGEEPSTAVDVALTPEEADRHLDDLLSRVTANASACRVLVDVLRAVAGLDVAAGLTVESLAYSTLLAGPDFARWLQGRTPPAARTFAGPPVTVEREGPLLRLTLARPENRNAFSAELRDALFEALTLAAVDDSIEQVVLAGSGPSFSSGGDLAEFGTTPDVVTAHQTRTHHSVGAILAQLAPKVTVQVQGACVGAGVELPAFAGRVVARPDATFRLPEIGMGLIPGAGGTVSVSRRIGRQHTARLAILGEAIDAEEALSLGLVDEVDASA